MIVVVSPQAQAYVSMRLHISKPRKSSYVAKVNDVSGNVEINSYFSRGITFSIQLAQIILQIFFSGKLGSTFSSIFILDVIIEV